MIISLFEANFAIIFIDNFELKRENEILIYQEYQLLIKVFSAI